MLTTADQVLLYVPNLIGYGRVVSTVLSLVIMVALPDAYWVTAVVLYLASFVGDLFGS